MERGTAGSSFLLVGWVVLAECLLLLVEPTLAVHFTAMASGDSLSVAAGDYEESVVILSDDIAIHFEAGAIVNCPSAANASGAWLSIYSTVAMTGELTLKDGGIAVLSSAASFNQSGKIDITIVACSGLAANTQWQQNGQATITAQTQSPDFSTSSGTHTILRWNQLTFYCLAPAVQIENLWQQDGTLHLITQMGVGVELAINSATWQQNGPANFEVSAGWQGQDLLPATGITLGIAPAWNQVGSLYLYVAGPGLYCDPDLNAGWTSDGPVEVNATNSAVRGPCKPMNGINSSPSPSITPTPSPTPSVTPSVTPTPSPTPSITPTPSVTPSPTPSPTATSTPTPSATASTTRSPSPTASMTATPSPTWSPLTSPSPTPSVSPSSSPVYLVSNTTQVAVVPVLLFNLTAPDVVLVPKDNEGRARSDAAVGTSIAFIHELSANGSIVEDDQFNSTSSFLFKADLLTDDLDAGVVTGRANESSAPPQPRVELQFFLFESASTVSVGAVSYDALPAFAKFTVRLFSWPWTTQPPLDDDDINNSTTTTNPTNCTIEMRMKITPAFVSATRRPDYPSTGLTTFVLAGNATSSSSASASASKTTELRLVESVELDGRQVSGAGGVEFAMDETTSELVLRFARFESSLVYDPDLGVLFGSSPTKGDGGGGDNLGLIVGVAVAVPVAVVVVVAVIVAGLVVTTVKRRRQQQARVNQLDQVNFHAL
ncbi:uncharacterized protein ACA1_031990 [Acanthamoeba castellanii str. Neff]|uniref:Uncharacterized protein n=1 Tax=Acanthamoeba castellanii (strain ATCC 30010 / Neff) TaxID=1257118 RepID=L8H1R4_ACACF|nr:uncharacterized protein ACA1_031990 [Acanthamoeba castellanii str. Neff]ELR19175.1 hypothetical protein ACA1_031990 [Acanthamoeba castellanii str. Neff]